MTQAPSLLEFRPVLADAVIISGVTEVTPEQVDLLKAPFVLGEPVKAVATLQNFSVTLNLSGVTLPALYRCRVYVYVVGSAAIYAPLSHHPTPPKLPKTKLFRLFGAEADNTNTVQVTLPQAAQVARLVCEVRGRFDPNAPPV